MIIKPQFKLKEYENGLYLVSTPLGNLKDITLRAIEVLQQSDYILCEDTRVSKNLLDKYQIKSKLISNHKFNEKKNIEKIIEYLKSAFELSEMGIKIVIGPVFYESLTYLDEMKDLTFLSLTNKTLDLPKNVISAGINSTSQFNTIKKFLETNQIQRTIFLTPIQDYEFEIKKGMKNSKIKIYKDYEYNTEPTKLTKQI